MVRFFSHLFRVQFIPFAQSHPLHLILISAPLLFSTGCFRIKPMFQKKAEFIPFTRTVLAKSTYQAASADIQSAYVTGNELYIKAYIPGEGKVSLGCSFSATEVQQQKPIDCARTEDVKPIPADAARLDVYNDSWTTRECFLPKFEKFRMQIGETFWAANACSENLVLVSIHSPSDKRYSGYALLVPFAFISDVLLDVLDIAASSIVLIPLLPFIPFMK